MSSQALTKAPNSSSQVQKSSSTSQNAVAPRQSLGSQLTGAISTPQKNTTQSVKTPQQQLLERPSPTPSTPGKWEHPRMAEILRRQHRTTFDQTSVQRVLYSTVALIVTMFGPDVMAKQLPRWLTRNLPAYLVLILYATQLVLVANITVAALPLLRSKDTMEDIPLTPQQRQLFDLPPMSRSATPQEQAAWVTPPRYSRNTTPNSVDSLTVNARGTPLSANGGFRSSAGSGSPHPRSPLGGRTSDVSRRDSLGSARGSPLAEKDIFSASTSKIGRTSTGLNNKWLYDKGKASPVPAGFLGSGWGTGSVFN